MVAAARVTLPASTVFLQAVQLRAHIDHCDHAAYLISATFAELAQSISQEQAQQLARSLPSEFSEMLVNHQDVPEGVDGPEFATRVANSAFLLNRQRATDQVRAVFRVIYQSVPRGGLDSVIAQLPLDVAVLFGTRDD